MKHAAMAVALGAMLACGGGLRDTTSIVTLVEYDWTLADWAFTQYVRGTGNAVIGIALGGSHPPQVNVNWGIFPGADNVSEGWLVGRQTTFQYVIDPARPTTNVIVNFEGQRSLDGGAIVEVAAALHQGGKVFVCDRRFHPAATLGAQSASGLQSADFDEWNPATRTFDTASHPNLANGTPIQLGFWAHSRLASPATLTDSFNLDELVLTFDLT